MIMLHQTLPGCINSGLKTKCKLLENFPILEVLLERPDRKNGMKYALKNITSSCPSPSLLLAFSDTQLQSASNSSTSHKSGGGFCQALFFPWNEGQEVMQLQKVSGIYADRVVFVFSYSHFFSLIDDAIAAEYVIS